MRDFLCEIIHTRFNLCQIQYWRDLFRFPFFSFSFCLRYFVFARFCLSVFFLRDQDREPFKYSTNKRGSCNGLSQNLKCYHSYYFHRIHLLTKLIWCLHVILWSHSLNCMQLGTLSFFNTEKYRFTRNIKKKCTVLAVQYYYITQLNMQYW